MTSATLPALLLAGTHAARPAATAVGSGALYACSDHDLIYQSDGAAWSTWADVAGSGIPATLLDAKGDLIVASAADTAARLAVGSNGSTIVAASGESTGLKWRLNNDAAAAAPTANDDSGDGYSVGSRWLDTTNDKEYVCLDATLAAAVWVETTASGGAGGDYAFESEVDVGVGGVAAVTFSSIPATGRHLEVHAVVRGEKAAVFDDLRLRINNDSGANYDYQIQSAFQTTNAASEGIGQTFVLLGQPAAGSAGAGIWSAYHVWLPYYADTTFHKEVYIKAAEKAASGTGGILVRHIAGFWRSTSAINRVDLFFAGGDVAEGSIVSLYLVD